jgi:hypothetical protein
MKEQIETLVLRRNNLMGHSDKTIKPQQGILPNVM